MSRTKRIDHRCITNRRVADANTVQFTDEMAESLCTDVLHCMSPEAYFMWMEDMQDMDVVLIETIWS